MDEKCIENMNEWIPHPPIPRKTKKNRQKTNPKRKRVPLSPPPPSPSKGSPKIFTKSFPLDLSKHFTKYLSNNDRIDLSLVNSNFYHFAGASQKISSYDLDYNLYGHIPPGGNVEKLEVCKVFRNIESLTIHRNLLRIRHLGDRLTKITSLSVKGMAGNRCPYGHGRLLNQLERLSIKLRVFSCVQLQRVLHLKN